MPIVSAASPLGVVWIEAERLATWEVASDWLATAEAALAAFAELVPA